jgi:hypothetical protein
MESEVTIKEISEELQKYQIDLPVQLYNYKQLRQEIAACINHLIANDFSLLISILYRLDISEKKLKQLLHETKNQVAGDIIAELIIERQLQKIVSRKAFKQQSPEIPDDEKW